MTYKERLIHEKILKQDDKGFKTELRILSIFIVESLVNILGFMLAKMPHSWFLRCIKAVAWLMKTFDKRRYFDAKANLDFVFGDSKSEEEKKGLLKRVMKILLSLF